MTIGLYARRIQAMTKFSRFFLAAIWFFTINVEIVRGESPQRMAEMHNVLHRLLFIGITISQPQVREKLKKASAKAQTAVVANNIDEFPKALAATDADWVYFRYLPPMGQMEDVQSAGKRSFIAGMTVSGNVPDNWKRAIDVGIDGILTDYPFELAAMLR